MNSTSTDSMLQIENLVAGYVKTPVLRDFSLRANAGEVVAVIGPNGCGKSTLLRCIAGTLAPQSGNILVDSENVRQLSGRERARRVALLPQNFAASDGWTNLTVEEVVLAGRTPYLPPYGAASRQDHLVVQDVLQAVDALPMRARLLNELSGGERQRVGLARALAQQPRLLLLDEPTSNLDIRYAHELLHLVFRVARRDRLAVVVVLHQINLAAAMADKMVLLRADGQTQAQGEPTFVMTEENLQSVYQSPLSISLHPRSGRPQAQSNWVFDE